MSTGETPSAGPRAPAPASAASAASAGDIAPERAELTTGRMSRVSGLSLKALRLYDARGLLVPARVDPVTGYRTYGPEQVARGRAIAALRRLDLPLAQVAEVLDAPPDRLRALLVDRWARQRAELAEQRGVVELLVERLTTTPDLAPLPDRLVEVRQVPGRKVATVTAHVSQDALVPTFTADLLTVRAHLEAAGALFGAEYWVIYHDPVGPDVTGRIETCVPYEGTIDPAGPMTLRVEPAQAQAFAPVPAADCRYPTILAYYELVDGWAEAHGGARGPSREIYPVPWCPDEGLDVGPVAEIAVPVAAVSERA